MWLSLKKWKSAPSPCMNLKQQIILYYKILIKTKILLPKISTMNTNFLSYLFPKNFFFSVRKDSQLLINWQYDFQIIQNFIFRILSFKIIFLILHFYIATTAKLWIHIIFFIPQLIQFMFFLSSSLYITYPDTNFYLSQSTSKLCSYVWPPLTYLPVLLTAITYRWLAFP